MKLCVVLFLCFAASYCENKKTSSPSSVVSTNKAIQKYSSKNSTLPTLEYYTTNKPTIHIKIHIDNALTKKLTTHYGPKTRRILKIGTQNLIKDVENFFQHTSLKQKIRLVLIDTKFLRNNTKVVSMSENATEYLKSYCEWQGMKKMDGKRYYSVMFTGLDIYVKGGKEGRSSTGRGYMGGLCSVNKSCALLEWNPHNIGYLLSHEIAHSMGVPHDGPPFNRCKGQGHMMAATYNPKRHPKSWSACSRRKIKWYLGSKRAWCLGPYKV